MSVQDSQCDTFRPDLTALLDGELPAAHAHAVRQHVKTCARCRRESELLGKTWDLLGSAEKPRLRRNLVGDIMARVRREAENPAQTAAKYSEASGVLLGAALLDGPAAEEPRIRTKDASSERLSLRVVSAAPATPADAEPAEAPAAGRGWRRLMMFAPTAIAAMFVGMFFVVRPWVGSVPADGGSRVGDQRGGTQESADGPEARSSGEVAPPALNDVLPPQIRDVEERRARFAARPQFFTYESQEQSPLLPVMAMGEGTEAMMMRMDPGLNPDDLPSDVKDQ
jgi:hypothetical protein